jgi:hypothetical protein
MVMLLMCPAAGFADAREYFYVPIESSSYDDLEHFSALGLWEGSLASRPLTRMEVTFAVDEIFRRSRSIGMGEGDLIRLKRLRAAFPGFPGEDSTRFCERPPTSGADGWRLPASWEIGGGLQYFGQAAQIDSLADLDRRERRDHGVHVLVRGAIGEHLTAESRTYGDYSRLTARPNSRGWTDNAPRGFRSAFTDPSSRNDLAVLGLHHRWFDITIGRQDRRWGTGRRGTLFLSETPFPLDGISFRFRTRHFSGTSLFAQTDRTPHTAALLDSADAGGQAGTPASGRRGDAYLAGHRFEVAFPFRARVGIYEAVVWGGRGPDLAYLNPIAFLVPITQDLADRAGVDDKKILGGDCTLDLHPVTLYGEFLLNRLVALDSAVGGESAQISSFAELIGARWADPFGFPGVDLDGEYSHVDPEVYFHSDGDPRRAFLTEGEIIGHWVGPNADVLTLSITGPPIRRQGTLKLEFEQIRWGLLDGKRGGQAGFVGMEKKDKRWIVGPKQVERTFALRWTRDGFRAPVRGVMNTSILLANVARTGAWSGRGWQAEMRISWIFDFRFHGDGGE